MADKKISELTELTTPDGTEELVVNDSGVSKKVQIDNLLAGGTIAGFTSTGIDDNATSTAITIASTGGVTIAPSTTPVALNLTPNNSNCDITFASTNTSSATRLRTSINDFQIHTNGVQKVSVGSGGDVTVNTGNLVIGTSGKGIDFSASSDTTASGASTGSEVLDDYEEGTFTPTLLFGGNATGMGMQPTTNGTYTKVGNLVTVNCYIYLSAKGSSTGAASIRGYPYISNSGSNTYTTATIWLKRVSYADTAMAYLTVNSTQLSLAEATNAGTYSNLDHSNFLDNSEMMMTMTYRVN